MARNTSIVIGDHFSHFVSEQVRSGRYGSTSDVVRAGLRLLEEHEARVRALGDAAAAGGPLPFDATARHEQAQLVASDINPLSGV
ncbi:type II toxin-antitoxin system ParD family antitoxin [Sphingobium yanoikuyae]|uniref:type II toxin-antitoxin system ParD family antitoxin n=1 Tax=Sphingobium yanoikuyae TaxID=13690 RepID=UPI00240F1D47|nr:type II toxin-antitoxin system ParD family antitoxin [Sphingobium yanoikuyae]MDG2515783.1 type II toxin-antitoxin system ParD family antitoxin [Sphingobium yanoikuyae]